MFFTYSVRSRETRVLIVEDEYLLAADISDRLSASGYEVVGPVASLQAALEVADQSDLHGAIVDIDLRGEPCYLLLDALIARDIPTIITTGFDRTALPERFRDMTIMTKPCDPASIEASYDAKRQSLRG